MPRRNAFIFFNTWVCQLHCSYCDYSTRDHKEKGYTMDCFGNSYQIEDEYPWPYWLALLDRFRPYHLDFCGGEPTIYNAFASMIMHFPKDSTWGMTSNTLNSKVINQLSSIGNVAWTASEHFNEDKDEIFQRNLWVLRRKGFNVRVTMVFTPDNYKQVEEKIEVYGEKKIPVNLHPIFQQGFSWHEHIDIYNRMKKIAVEKNENNMINFISDISKTFQGKGKNPACPGGSNYFALSPDGKIYRCVSSYLVMKHDPIGHIKDFEPSQIAKPCDGGCLFTCDFDCRKGRWEV